jgi:lytic murein transglycosylase
MKHPSVRAAACLLAAALSLLCGDAWAQGCGQGAEGFSAWLEGFKRHAIDQGLSTSTVAVALAGVNYDPEVIRLDRSQKPFKLTFEKFAAQRITKGRLRIGRRVLQQHAELLARIEQRFGVPGPILVAIWGLETDFGTHMGERPVVRSLATLAYDCRRSERFQGELLSALRLLDRGDLRLSELRGAWAGELGQTQFLASSYERFAIDFDGDGRADLLHSVPDVLASTAHYLWGHGWNPGGGWEPGTANFEVIASWNRSKIYQKTIALFATRIARG